MAKPFIVVGDKTEHGGTVLTGSPETGIRGQAVARCTTRCSGTDAPA
ncbi:PAAR domain-containing protein [Vulcaniibacterium tengchongense]|uniref:PAAR motif-containing protein n=1 Tax=Vulcaniibacterium tengchongense TaxID=1273429 RepID=A0A3N4VB17_9GAMM|nr:PAAR domain-containing protein [Vulcaniibacterium tengchongense]RPE80196.1 PAAR motif-containing protein [Vulcaniibacterium tengchongense]